MGGYRARGTLATLALASVVLVAVVAAGTVSMAPLGDNGPTLPDTSPSDSRQVVVVTPSPRPDGDPTPQGPDDTGYRPPEDRSRSDDEAASVGDQPVGLIPSITEPGPITSPVASPVVVAQPPVDGAGPAAPTGPGAPAPPAPPGAPQPPDLGPDDEPVVVVIKSGPQHQKHADGDAKRARGANRHEAGAPDRARVAKAKAKRAAKAKAKRAARAKAKRAARAKAKRGSRVRARGPRWRPAPPARQLHPKGNGKWDAKRHPRQRAQAHAKSSRPARARAKAEGRRAGHARGKGHRRGKRR